MSAATEAPTLTDLMAELRRQGDATLTHRATLMRELADVKSELRALRETTDARLDQYYAELGQETEERKQAHIESVTRIQDLEERMQQIEEADLPARMARIEQILRNDLAADGLNSIGEETE